MYEHNRSLMEFVQETGMPVPKAFLAAAELSLNLRHQGGTDRRGNRCGRSQEDHRPHEKMECGD